MSRLTPVFCALAALALASPARAFTQFVPGLSCEGHEWITGASARKLVKKYPQLKGGMVIAHETKCPQCITYGADNFLVYSAIVGERNVDTGGLPGLPRTLGSACLNALVQDPDELQHYHSLRGRCEAGKDGRNTAIEKTKGTIKALYKAALQALGSDGLGKRAGTVDGGATQQTTMVDTAFFLFGRAAHVFQDSFSPEHTTRDASGRYHRILDVRTYVCTEDSPIHRHSDSGPAQGDVVFPTCRKGGNFTLLKNYWDGVKTFNKNAAWAVEGMVDLWTAFLEHRDSIDDVLDRWMAYDPDAAQPAFSVSAADKGKCLKQQGTHSSQAARAKKCAALLAPAGGGLKYWWPKKGVPSLSRPMSQAQIDKLVGAIRPASGSTCKNE